MRPVEEIHPHRSPFLFLDEVLEMGETTLEARRAVRAEEPHFAGHDPHRTPGDELGIHAEHLESRAGAHMMEGNVLVDGKMACSLEFAVMLVDDEG